MYPVSAGCMTTPAETRLQPFPRRVPASSTTSATRYPRHRHPCGVLTAFAFPFYLLGFVIGFVWLAVYRETFQRVAVAFERLDLQSIASAATHDETAILYNLTP